MRHVLILCCFGLAAMWISHVAAQSSGGSFSITRSVVAPAASSSGGAFTMSATVGQSAIGESSAGAFQLQSGYIAAASSDNIFSNGFEP